MYVYIKLNLMKLLIFDHFVYNQFFHVVGPNRIWTLAGWLYLLMHIYYAVFSALLQQEERKYLLFSQALMQPCKTVLADYW